MKGQVKCSLSRVSTNTDAIACRVLTNFFNRVLQQDMINITITYHHLVFCVITSSFHMLKHEYVDIWRSYEKNQVALIRKILISMLAQNQSDEFFSKNWQCLGYMSVSVHIRG